MVQLVVTAGINVLIIQPHICALSHQRSHSYVYYTLHCLVDCTTLLKHVIHNVCPPGDCSLGVAAVALAAWSDDRKKSVAHRLTCLHTAHHAGETPPQTFVMRVGHVMYVSAR